MTSMRVAEGNAFHGLTRNVESPGRGSAEPLGLQLKGDMIEAPIAVSGNIERLVLITHREPFAVQQRDEGVVVERSVGGLIAALEPAMRQTRGVWVSIAPKKLADQTRIDDVLQQLPYEWLPVTLDDDIRDNSYLCFSNGALWPLYHSLLGDAVYHRHHWQAYMQANTSFADIAAPTLRANDLVWVHDYQLSLLPALLRKRGLPRETRIGFFLHVPFPPFDLFRTLPWAEKIIDGMLGASLIGFHVAEYVQNFLECVEQIKGLRCDRMRGRVLVDDRWVQVRAIPIGIDSRQYVDGLTDPRVQERAIALRAEIGAEKIIVGVDRLDFTKGICERLRALDAFFERYPERQGQVSLVQIAVPSRIELPTYKALREEIERLVGHINGRYARPGWTPITYMFRSLPFEELLPLYLAADVALVTPLRDGMNLVAKEFVAAHRERCGVLILSELAGAAQQLTEAILVNPYDVDAIADAIERALLMPADQQTRRLRAMNIKVERYDVSHWIEAFLAEALYAE